MYPDWKDRQPFVIVFVGLNGVNVNTVHAPAFNRHCSSTRDGADCELRAMFTPSIAISAVRMWTRTGHVVAFVHVARAIHGFVPSVTITSVFAGIACPSAAAPEPPVATKPRSAVKVSIS